MQGLTPRQLESHSVVCESTLRPGPVQIVLGGAMTAGVNRGPWMSVAAPDPQRSVGGIRLFHAICAGENKGSESRKAPQSRVQRVMRP